ncbi:methylated-DNA--[protein]-cysteine S-methyltransferase [Candidatus Nanohalovita haloferacivicina]|uniref:methylated-DNA--[protein]-cysteine S-methyltransferase n=1 Tax=Candidatus Nanohalovita haloferacivicina TaxID=2978046 RepID=UPI00325FDB3F|nr:Methylated DNA-protein cysteine methyltransferase [Candidatus Nanohalobia archaeon BNXNv]
MKITIYGRTLNVYEQLIEEPREEVNEQLNEYFNGDRETFDLEYDIPEGFVGDVLREIQKIDYGETKTYGDIAEEVDGIPVAVGQALSQNPLPLIIPCHRVVGKNSVGGYLGESNSDVKRKLLQLEK